MAVVVNAFGTTLEVPSISKAKKSNLLAASTSLAVIALVASPFNVKTPGTVAVEAVNAKISLNFLVIIGFD